MKTFLIIIFFVVIAILLTFTPIPIIPPTATSTPMIMKWDKTAIKGPTIKIIIMRKISTNPTAYEAVRVVEGISNTGSYELTGTTTGLYIQVGCEGPHPEGCMALPIFQG